MSPDELGLTFALTFSTGRMNEAMPRALFTTGRGSVGPIPTLEEFELAWVDARRMLLLSSAEADWIKLEVHDPTRNHVVFARSGPADRFVENMKLLLGAVNAPA